MAKDGRTIKMSISETEFFTVYFTSPTVSPVVRLLPRPSPRRCRQTIHKLQSTLLSRCSHRGYKVATGGTDEIPAGKCEERTRFSGRDIWRRVGRKKKLVAIYHYSLFLSFSPAAPHNARVFFSARLPRPTDQSRPTDLYRPTDRAAAGHI